MDAKTILTVMPIYNAEKTLKAAIDGILSQTYSNLHLVLVDDASTDSSLAIAKEYTNDRRVTIIRNTENQGAYYCRNLGLYKFRREAWAFFTTHDADDVSNPDRFAIMVKHLANNRTMSVQDTWERKKLSTKKSISVSLTCAHAMFKRKVFEDIGYFDMMRFGADWEYWARVNEYNKVNNFLSRSIKEVMGNSYVASNNLTEQIPEGSVPRQAYVKAAREEHAKARKSNKIIYRPFSPSKSKARSVEMYSKSRGTTTKAVKAERAVPRHNNVRITVVLLTWQRLGKLKHTLSALANQTFDNFEVYISNANNQYESVVDKTANRFKDNLKIRVSHDGNDQFAFRRFAVGKKLAEEGTDIILFIDDDITFDSSYVETCLRYYEPKTYKSGFAWNFQDGGSDYYAKRKRVFDLTSVVHYCGTGISVIDASIFKDKGLIKKAPPLALKIEDLWLSYYAQHVKKWRLGYVPMSNVVLGGADEVALYKSVLKDKKDGVAEDKADFLRQLVSEYKWKLPKQL